MRFTVSCIGIVLCFLTLCICPQAAAESTSSSQPDVGQQTNLIVASLMMLVMVKFTVAGGLGYLWYRKSKYKKQKVILDA